MDVNCYDYGKRFYDPALGRFTTIDPLSEKYTPMSPYAYTANNPIKYIDPDGAKIKWGDNVTREDKRFIRRNLRAHSGSKTYRKMMRTLRRSDNVYTLKTSNKSSDKLAEFHPNIGQKGSSYTEYDEGMDQERTIQLSEDNPVESLGGDITFYTKNLSEANGEGTETGVEEFVHALQYDTYITSKSLAYKENIPTLNWEFEAKTVVGIINLESRGNFRTMGFEMGPTNLARNIKSFGLNKSNVGGLYSSSFSMWLGFVDAMGGYNGNLSTTPGAVLNSQPQVLNNMLKK